MTSSSSQERGPLLPTRLLVDPEAFIAPGAILVGEVTIGRGSSVWYGCVLRGDLEPIRIGSQSTRAPDGG